MSKLFFDHLIYLEELEIEIKKTTSSAEEREELWTLVDEIVTHKVLGKVLDKLPQEHHDEFLTLFHKCPHDEITIFGYLKSKAGENVEKELQKEFKHISTEILQELKTHDEITAETKLSKK